MTMATLICFSCCFEDQPQPKTRRPRLDPTMIGMPTNFRHTAHIGSGDVSNNTRSITLNYFMAFEPILVHMSSKVANLENQMSSKGGYDHVSPVNIELKVVDLPSRNQT